MHTTIQVFGQQSLVARHHSQAIFLNDIYVFLKEETIFLTDIHVIFKKNDSDVATSTILVLFHFKLV